MLHQDIDRYLGAIETALDFGDEQALRIHARSFVDRTRNLVAEVADG